MSLTEEHVLRLAKKHGLSLKKDTLKNNDSGLDFQVVIATDMDDQDWVLRLPRRKDVQSKLQNENNILKVVNSQVLFEVPIWTICTDELIAYKKLDGVPTATIDHQIMNYRWILDKDNIPSTFYETLATVLSSLHQIPHELASKEGIYVETPTQLRGGWEKRMDTVREHFKVNEHLWDRWQRWLSDDKYWPSQTGFIHGDIHPGHILIHDKAKVTGLIDWTEAKVSDTSHDFAAHYLIFGEQSLKELVRCYEKQGGFVWSQMVEHIQELTMTNAVRVGEFAMESGLEKYHTMAANLLYSEPNER
ncbi:macrolide 2'-phosphotransferase [Shimazuella kribbensis]|uniref:macrolide 2'-phosphotransferase n=1 Tax=Shimazuella kribbensis TaxID=139808 RepID=UPI0003FAB7B5|nr:macrolide 2'-phosphotransferase [Shimazuella kribbensis]